MDSGLKKYLTVIEERRETLYALSDYIWEHPETAFMEYESEKALIDFFKREGFVVTEQAYGVETAFYAEYGSGNPRIGMLGEYDALSGLDQEAGLIEKRSRHPGACGHGCGHNLLGVGCAAAALAVKRYLEDGHPGTVIYYGCPGEEGGSGKAFMAREGAFKDLDCALSWHPFTMNEVLKDSTLANFQVLYTFKGIAAHAAACPEMGRSALDALELMNIGCNFLREHMADQARVHYAITDTGGFSPNVVQEQASAVYLVRAPKIGQAYELLQRVHKIAQGAALMTETAVDYELVKSCANVVPNRVLERFLFEAMAEVGIPEYTQEERESAAAYSATAPSGTEKEYAQRVEDCLDPENASMLKSHGEDPIYDFLIPYEAVHRVRVDNTSTDVGDVSWQCPTAQIRAAAWAPGTPMHSWQAVAQGKSPQAHKGMLYAGMSMGLAAIALMEDPEALRAAKEEFEAELKGQQYIPIPAGVRPRPIHKAV